MALIKLFSFFLCFLFSMSVMGTHSMLAVLEESAKEMKKTFERLEKSERLMMTSKRRLLIRPPELKKFA